MSRQCVKLIDLTICILSVMLIKCTSLCVSSQWWAGVCVTRLLLRDRFACRVTFPLWDFFICMAVYTYNDSELSTWGGREKDISFMFLHLHLPTRRGKHHIIQSK